jgi:hypothetical protein
LTIKDLQKLIESQETAEQQQMGLSTAMQKMVDECPRTFYKWTDENHRTLSSPINSKICCYWHWISPPFKDGEPMPCLPYQRLLYKLLGERKKFIIRKSRGIGMSTWLLYWLLFKALTEWKPGDRVCIITGNALRLSEDLISRLKGLTQRHYPEVYSELIKQSSTTAIINGVIFEGMPLRFVSLRGYDHLKAIVSDETDYYPLSQQRQLLDTIIPFVNKPNSNSHLILVSTPASAFGIMRQIESEPNSGWYSMVLDYNYGLEGPRPIFDKEKLEQTRRTNPEQWAREFECQYINIAGSCFSSNSIDAAVELAKKYPDVINKNAEHSLGVDAGFGSSAFALVCLEYSDNIIKVVYAKQFERTSYNDMLQEVWNIRNMVGTINNVYTDQANPEFTKDLKEDFGDITNWQYIHDTLNKYRHSSSRIENSGMKVIPVSFSQEGASMLVHVKNLLEHEPNLVAINSKYTQLIMALKGAVSVDFHLNKKESPLNDLTDAFRLACKYWELEK